MRRTKIVCTIGPSSEHPETIRGLVEAGMNVARLNFSHGDHRVHRRYHETIRAVAHELDREVAILMDLQGPRMRTGPLCGHDAVQLNEGATLCITTRNVPGGPTCVSTTYSRLPEDAKVGARLLIADGTLELVVDRVTGSDVFCTVVRGGLLGEHKGFNLPGATISAPALTSKDLDDLDFGLTLGVDYVALSFVRSPDDVRAIKTCIADSGSDVPVVAKIEHPDALDHIDEIVALSDGIMVARGDLGVEIMLEEIPQIQKALIHKCNQQGIPVITATQMLESMVTNSRPTRAEVTDVANAVYDGSDAVMLSGETAAGRHPVEAVNVMSQIVTRADEALAERTPDQSWISGHESRGLYDNFAGAIGEAAHRISEMLDVTRIVCFTKSGYTAGAIARCRPRVPITAITLSEETRRRCALLWGVEAVKSVDLRTTDEMVKAVDSILLDYELASTGETVIITAGTPLAVGGRTNMLKLHTVGDTLRPGE